MREYSASRGPERTAGRYETGVNDRSSDTAPDECPHPSQAAVRGSRPKHPRAKEAKAPEEQRTKERVMELVALPADEEELAQQRQESILAHGEAKALRPTKTRLVRRKLKECKLLNTTHTC